MLGVTVVGPVRTCVIALAGEWSTCYFICANVAVRRQRHCRNVRTDGKFSRDICTGKQSSRGQGTTQLGYMENQVRGRVLRELQLVRDVDLVNDRERTER